jgi:hypothetical protein
MGEMYDHDGDRHPPSIGRRYDRYDDRELEYGDQERDRDPILYAPDYQPYPADFQLPSPPPPRTSVFNRLGSSSSELPNLPNLPSSPSPLLEDPDFAERNHGDREKDRERVRVAALEKRLDLPLDALTKKSKQEKKVVSKNQKRPQCVFYLDKGMCKNGGACKFSHSKRAKLDM